MKPQPTGHRSTASRWTPSVDVEERPLSASGARVPVRLDQRDGHHSCRSSDARPSKRPQSFRYWCVEVGKTSTVTGWHVHHQSIMMTPCPTRIRSARSRVSPASARQPSTASSTSDPGYAPARQRTSRRRSPTSTGSGASSTSPAGRSSWTSSCRLPTGSLPRSRPHWRLSCPCCDPRSSGRGSTSGRWPARASWSRPSTASATADPWGSSSRHPTSPRSSTRSDGCTTPGSRWSPWSATFPSVNESPTWASTTGQRAPRRHTSSTSG